MDKVKKKRIKRILSLVCIAAVVALLAAMPFIARQELETDDPQASILSGTVQTGSIDRELIGGGTLAEEDAVNIQVPSAVKLTKFLVSNGDSVEEGDPIAAVDRVTVMTAIAQVQDTLDYLAEQIEAESEEDADGEVVALAGGIVKVLYAQEGESVQEVMLRDGALAVLSLDGLMAVDLTAESDLKAGSTVTLTFGDDAQVSGKIVKNLAGEITVTVEDDDYAIGEKVTVSCEETVLGSGELYIYSPWNATAYAGTIEDVEVSEGETVNAGETLMELENVGFTATYHQLVSQRREYEDLMLELFQMYQTEQITAPCDGVVSGVDKNSVQLLAATQDFVIHFLSNAPNGNDEIQYLNYVGQVTAVGENGFELLVNPNPVSVTDYKNLSEVPVDPATMTYAAGYTGNEPIYTLVDDVWQQIPMQEINAGDILLFACDENNGFVWIVRVQATQQPEPDPDMPPAPSEPTDPSEPADPGIPTDPSTPSNPDNPNVPGGTEIPGGSITPGGSGFPSGSGSITFPSTGISGITGSYSGSYPSSGSMSGYPQLEQESAFELYGLDMSQVAAVTPQNTMTLEITIDELDITALKPGMDAQVKVNALGGEKFTATITDVQNTGTTNNGGNSKFVVELTLARGANMLVGMNATATIILETVENVLAIPASALVEVGTTTMVYTGYDEETETLLNPVVVTAGVSDGETVQILEGLSAGETYYYAYYDTLEISFAPDFAKGGFMFG